MKNPYEYGDMQDIVRASAARVLGCSVDSLSSETSLVGDLGADSLDLVELRCEIEDRLGMVMPQQSVLDHLVEIAGDSDAAYQGPGRMTELAARVLRLSAFRYTEEQAAAGMAPYEVARRSTIANWAHFVHSAFDHLPASCPGCAGSVAALSPAHRAQCAGCGAPLTPVPGDEVLAAGVREALGTEAVAVGKPAE
ncbi:acyl carrier protein [Streptomyces sp. NPDC055607]